MRLLRRRPRRRRRPSRGPGRAGRRRPGHRARPRRVAPLARRSWARWPRARRTEREHAIREPRADRPPREPRPDRPAREPAPFVSGKPAEGSATKSATLDTAKTVLEEMVSLMGLDATVEIARGGDTARST